MCVKRTMSLNALAMSGNHCWCYGNVYKVTRYNINWTNNIIEYMKIKLKTRRKCLHSY